MAFFDIKSLADEISVSKKSFSKFSDLKCILSCCAICHFDLLLCFDFPWKKMKKYPFFHLDIEFYVESLSIHNLNTLGNIYHVLKMSSPKTTFGKHPNLTVVTG
jgi:hypothetical protein